MNRAKKTPGRRRRTGNTPPRGTRLPGTASTAESHDDPAVCTQLGDDPPITRPDHAGETVLNYELRDSGSVEDYWHLHLTAKSACEQRTAEAKQARADEARQAKELNDLQQQAEQLAARVMNAQHALHDSTQRAEKLEAEAGRMYRRSQDHKDTTDRLCLHNNLQHPAGEAAPPASMAPEEALDQTGHMALSPGRAQ